jgi:hypothetical protein
MTCILIDCKSNKRGKCRLNGYICNDYYWGICRYYRKDIYKVKWWNLKTGKQLHDIHST